MQPKTYIRRHLNLLLYVNLLFFCSPFGAEAAHEIVAVQSSRLQPYEQALQGFTSLCQAEVTRLIISELQGKNLVREIKALRPDMILAVGNEALERLKRISDIPIVYLMVLNPESLLTGQENITGVSITIPPERQLRTLATALPQKKRIGIIYDPQHTGYLVKRAREAAEALGITLITKAVAKSREVPTALMAMQDGIDIFWMLPDLTVITQMTVEFIFTFALENRIPVITFSEKYVESGALLSVGIDAFDIGVQAAEMARMILAGNYVKQVRRADARTAVVASISPKIARKAVVSINRQIAGNLGITIDAKITAEARIIN